MWTKVNGYENMPLGIWIVEVQQAHWGLYFHTASVNANGTVIGGRFGYDMPKVIAYTELPERFSSVDPDCAHERGCCSCVFSPKP